MKPDYIQETNGAVIISLIVQPRSSKNEITGAINGMLKLKVKSPPVAGEANEAIIKFFSKLLKTPKKDMSIIKGEKSKRKKIKIANADIDNVTKSIEPYL